MHELKTNKVYPIIIRAFVAKMYTSRSFYFIITP